MAVVERASAGAEVTPPGRSLEEVYAPPKSATPDEPRREAESTAAKSPLREAPWVATTYFGEGLPYSIVHQVSAELFTAFGASLQAIGYTSLYGFAWNTKFLWSPFVDIYGARRGWVVATQIALGLAMLALAMPADRGDLPAVAWGLVAVSVLAATQDISVDGFYLDALPEKRQAAFSGLRVAAFRVAMLVAKGGLVMLAGIAGGWRYAFFAAAAMMLLLGVGHALLLPRPVAPARAEAEARVVPKADASYLQAFVTFLRQPNVGLVLAFILTFRAGDALMFAMHTPFLKDLGLNLAQRGFVSGTWGTVSSIAGSILGGMVVSRLGLERTLKPIAILQSAAIPLYAWLAWTRPGITAIAAVVLVEQFVAYAGSTAFMVFIMRRCQGAYRATHFAIGSALMSLATTLAGSVSGHLAERVGFTTFFLIAFAASIPGVIVSMFVPTNRADEEPAKPAQV
ncbi:MFS transporter [Polyangium sp. y55x31]|uniref:MFS transporter n=1 Tax=Polyangium sp. y55x31 TaxID=3042688 RepID=UPI002482A239|nr:MFS transporter [Polyangium sp. y55x31]MDI1475806.1 MFS transporter [Polyangium sp. y55x31]